MSIIKPKNKTDNQQQKKEDVVEKQNSINESKQIPVDNQENDAPSVQMDFQSEEVANSFASQDTKKSDSTEGASLDVNQTIDQVRNDINEFEESKSGKLTIKDLYKQAEFLINLLDTGISTFFNWLARDSSSTAYAMPASNKKLLIEQLTLILVKYQSKFKVEYMFFAGLLVLYAPMTIASVKSRREKNKLDQAKKKEIQERKPDEKFYRHPEQKSQSENTSIEKTEQKPLDTLNIPLKRKRGGQRKV